MMTSQIQVLSIIVAILQLHSTYAGNGYHYDPPVKQVQPNTGGHHFGPLPTIAPLPPVPAIPPLPTGRPGTHIQTQSLIQTHPAPYNGYTASKSIANAYRPPSAPRPQSTYLPPSAPAFTGTPNIAPQLNNRFGFPQAPSVFGQRLQPSGPSAPAYPTAPFVPTAPAYPNGPATLPQAEPQPLRIPFGKQAVVHLPNAAPGDVYEHGGRQLKQYAVIEIIDNDIQQNMQPFLTTPFIDDFRAHIGASGTGAVPPPPGQQIESRSNALAFEQQRLAQRRPANGNDAVALGSGGLGFVRLPNGSVYLGSGSLAYISGQQHSASIQDARTRTGAPMPDPLHFGHGPLGHPSNPSNTRNFRF